MSNPEMGIGLGNNRCIPDHSAILNEGSSKDRPCDGRFMLRGMPFKAFFMYIEKEFGPARYRKAIEHAEKKARALFPEVIEKNGWYDVDFILGAVEYLRALEAPDSDFHEYMEELVYRSLMEEVTSFLRVFFLTVGVKGLMERYSNMAGEFYSAGKPFAVELKDRPEKTFVVRIINASCRAKDLCTLTRGSLSALVHKVTGRRPRLIETRCIEHGDNLCEFELIV